MVNVSRKKILLLYQNLVILKKTDKFILLKFLLKRITSLYKRDNIKLDHYKFNKFTNINVYSLLKNDFTSKNIRKEDIIAEYREENFFDNINPGYFYCILPIFIIFKKFLQIFLQKLNIFFANFLSYELIFKYRKNVRTWLSNLNFLKKHNEILARLKWSKKESNINKYYQDHFFNIETKDKKIVKYYKSFVFFHGKKFNRIKNLDFFFKNIKKKNIILFKSYHGKKLYNEHRFYYFDSPLWTFFHFSLSKIYCQNIKVIFDEYHNLNLNHDLRVFEKNYLHINGQIYLRLELIGKGGSGKVYKILRKDRKIFALKKNKIDQFNTQIAHNFINEIIILKLLSGKSSIVQIQDAEINFEKKMVSIILEYGDYDLESLIKEKKNKSDLSCIKFYWKQILEAVNEIHQERIVHGDLKPSNFLFVDNSLKLIDFGISKTIENNTTNITRDIHVGTLNYMSPEAVLEIPGILGKAPKFKSSRSSDIWSLGCILFKLSQGAPPFKKFSMIEKIHAIINNTLKIKYSLVSNHCLTDIIDNCLKRNPDFRPTIPELLRHSFFNFE